MLNKTIIALSAVALLGSASLAYADEVPEHKIGDRYPFLEKTYAPVTSNTAAPRLATRQFTANTQNEAPENKLGDRFAFLVNGYAPAAQNAQFRWTQPQTVRTQAGYEAPENKIGDRYPFLEQTYAARGGATGVVTVRMHRNGRGV